MEVVTDRLSAARAFGKVGPWRVYEDSQYLGLWFDMAPDRGIVLETNATERLLELPEPDAPLHDHLAFLARIATAVHRDSLDEFPVFFTLCMAEVAHLSADGETPDWSWAALRAGTAAPRGAS